MTDQSSGQQRLLLRPEEAAEVLSVSRTTLYGLLRSGAIRSVKVGGLRRIPVEALERYVTDLAGNPGAMPPTPLTNGAAVVGTTTGRAGRPGGAGLLVERGETETRLRPRSVQAWADGQGHGGHQDVAP